MPTTVRSGPDISLLGARGHNEPGPQDTSLGSRLPPDISVRQAALVAGIGLLLMTLLAPFADFGVLQKLVVPGDAQTTAQNIAAAEGLFRLAIGSFLVVAILDVVVAWGLYLVFKPVNRSLSLLAAVFRIVYATMFAVAVTNLVSALQVAGGGGLLKGFGADQLQPQMMVLLSAFQSGWDLALIIFGLHLLILGTLVFQSGKWLRVLGLLVVIAGLGYLVDGCGKLLVPNYSLSAATYTFLGELLLMVWLLWKGIKGFTTDVRKQA